MGSYTKSDQTGPAKEKDTRSFQEKYGKPLDRSKYAPPARKAYKWEPKPGYRMPQQSSKQAAKLASYEKGKRAKYGDTPDVCESCGRNDLGISCSHIVPRSHSFALVDYPANHKKQCFVCHQLTEEMRFWMLGDGLKIMELLWDGLGGIGRQRFWKAYHAHDGMNANLWKQSTFYNPEIHE